MTVRTTLCVILPLLSLSWGVKAISNANHLLDPIRYAYNVPALGGLVLNISGNVVIGAVGVRSFDADVNVTSTDLWHLGANNNAITATLVGRLVEKGVISWNTTMGDVYAKLNLRSDIQTINFLHLLSHVSGCPANANWGRLAISHPSLKGQRTNAVISLNTTGLLSTPGTQPLYSNWGYTVAGAMMEEVTGQSYEDLMAQEVFEPLNMTSVGYGPTSGPDVLTQPWGHSSDRIPEQLDNALVMSPAGTVHCSLEDWAKFVQDQLRGKMGQLGTLLLPETYQTLQEIQFGSGFCLGWVTGAAGWAQGSIIWYNGSNTLNYAMMAIDSTGGIAVIVVCNMGDTYSPLEDAIEVLVAEARRLQLA